MPDVQSFHSQHLCQDPLERFFFFFGLQRQRGGDHENPNAVEFAKNIQALRVVNLCASVHQETAAVDPFNWQIWMNHCLKGDILQENTVMD